MPRPLSLVYFLLFTRSDLYLDWFVCFFTPCLFQNHVEWLTLAICDFFFLPSSIFPMCKHGIEHIPILLLQMS